MAIGTFKRIFVASTLEKAAMNTLRTWFPVYLMEVEEQLGLQRGKIPVPQYYTNRTEFDTQAGEQVPRCTVYSSGLADAPTVWGTGQYTAVWELGIGVTSSDMDEEVANDVCKIYGAGVRAIIEQQPSLGGISSSTRWTGESYEDLPLPGKLVFYKAAAVEFQVVVDNVITGAPAGPDSPTPPYEYGDVEHIYIDVNEERRVILP